MFFFSGIDRIQRVLRLLVASTDGNLYVYNLDNVEPSGDLMLMKVCRIIPSRIGDGEPQATANSTVSIADPSQGNFYST